ncbi:MAG: hypothetical protein K9W43_11555 [Candidatus Thorarchaeota archaeon]|nr:hypothetical protein [Candidatus Thorarchaeota archaeon]
MVFFADNDCHKEFEAYLKGQQPWRNEYELSVPFVCFSMIVSLVIALVSSPILGYIGRSITDDSEILSWLTVGIPALIWIGTGSLILKYPARKDGHRGCRNISRGQIADAIEFVDMILAGHVERRIAIGQDIRFHSLYDSQIVRSHAKILSVFAPDESKSWLNKIESHIGTVVSTRRKNILKVAIAFWIIVLTIFFGFVIMDSLNIQLAPTVEILIIMVVISIAIIVAAVINPSPMFSNTTKERLKPELNDPDIQNESLNLINSILQVLEMDLRCPIRLNLIGKYPRIYRTGKQFTTTKGVTVYESFILSSTFEAPPEWLIENELS